MPLVSVGGGASLTWQLSATNTGYSATTQGPDQTQSFSLTNIPATWNQIYAHEFSLNPAAFSEFDLTSLTNLVNENFAFAHVLGICVIASGVSCRIGPGQTNGLQWFWDDGTAYSTVFPNGNGGNGVLFWFDDPAGTGTAVSGGAKTLRITNPNGAGVCTASVEILGSTT